MLSEGMFMDGLWYATISRNLSEGVGSFWDLRLTDAIYPHFHEHPPLAFGLQSLFFSVFGDHLFVERFYSLLTYVVTAFLVVKIWNIVQAKSKGMAWLPLLLWMTIPLVFWGATNNMLENTMMVFTTLAVFLMLKAKDSNSFLMYILAGMSIFFAFLSKGPVGLFVLSLPFWMFVLTREYPLIKAIKHSCILLLGLIIPFIVLYFIIPQGWDSIMMYLQKQVVGSLEKASTVDSRFWIVGRVLSELIPMIIIVVLLWIFNRNNNNNNNNNINNKVSNDQLGFLFIALGFSGILPIIVSMKQSGFYILSSFPLISIGVGFLILPKLEVLINKINGGNKFKRIFPTISILLFVGSLFYMFSYQGVFVRDKGKLTDVYKMMKIIPQNSILSAPKKLRKDWTLHGYLYRNAHISIEPNNTEYSYFISQKGFSDSLLIQYKKIDLDLKLYNLYKRNK